MAHGTRTPFANPVVEWIDQRLPIFTMMQKEYGVFPTPKNFNYFWNFGAIAMFCLITMIVTGIFLAMNYTPNASMAFDSVERIMRDVNYGWLLRYIHMNGASMFFIAVYVHIFRGLYYGSYKKPRELLWIFGVVILLLMMATGFMGYTLPWSQMSGWGATVITSLFSSIPVVGDPLVHLLWGGFSVDNPTLNRFFALHYLLPFIIVAVVFLHVWALHVTGSNNPLGIEPKSEKDTLPFHPYYTMKDMFGLSVFIIIFAMLVFFAPLKLTHPDHFVPFNPLVTPAHIVPEWYFLPFYAILRSVTFDIAIPFTHITLIEAKLGGVLAMFGAIVLLGALPWLDTHPVRSCKFRPWFRLALIVLVLDLCVLTWVGAQVAEQPFVMIGQIATAYYFVFFLVICPLLSRKEKALPMPNSIHEAVLAKKGVLSVLVALALFLAMPTAARANEGTELPKRDWTFSGPLGTFDRAQLQRGFQVYKEVCAACHSMRLGYYRDLTRLGYTEDEVKAIAAENTVQDGPNDEGEMFERPARPSDHFKSPFANDQAARAANGGALPPDLSLLARARFDGADYITAILTGYEAAPAGFKLSEGMNYNKYFAGHQIAMPQPLASAGQVTYADGTEATVPQMAKDVTAFLVFMTEPQQEKRKQMGVAVLLFLGVFSALMYGVKRKVWSKLH